MKILCKTSAKCLSTNGAQESEQSSSGNYMKSTIITILLALVALTGLAQMNNYTVSGDLSTLFKGTSYVVKYDSVYILNDSTRIIRKGQKQQKFAVKDGKFEISGYVRQPLYSTLQIDVRMEHDGETEQHGLSRPFILEAGNIVMDSQWAIFGGTPLNDASTKACTRLHELWEAGQRETLKKEALDFVRQHAADPAAIYVTLEAPNFMQAKDILPMINLCKENGQQNVEMYFLEQRLIEEVKAPQEGDMFVDFAVEYDGKTTRLSDYVGRGQYVLVDFWASWCGPCLAEMPNVSACYEKYHPKGLDIVAISFDSKKDAWLRAINNMKMPWVHLSDLAGWQSIAATTYGIKGIPANILLDGEGKIVDIDLRGELLDMKLAEIFKEKSR